MLRIFAVVLLAGCAASSWRHASKSDQEFHEDAFACDRLVSAERLGGTHAYGQPWHNCMLAKGWRPG